MRPAPARTRLFLASCVLASGVSLPVLAIEDEATGFAIEPPAPLTAERIENPAFTAAFGIRAPAGSPQPSAGNEFLCQIGYLVQAREVTQDEINALTLQPGYIASLAPSLDAAFAGHQETIFTVATVAGLEILATPRDVASNRLYTALLQTPSGIVQQHCTTTAADLDTALPLFRAIRDSVALP